MPQETNLEKLQNAGCIPPDATLSAAELQVIDGLSNNEVRTLIDIRQRLTETSQLSAESLTTDGSDDPLDGILTPNIIV